MSTECPFCETQIKNRGPMDTHFKCLRCGPVYIPLDIEGLAKQSLSTADKNAISITLRNEHERSGRKDKPTELTTELLREMAGQYKPLTPLEKVDRVLFNYDMLSKYVGHYVKTNCSLDYPFYHCTTGEELHSILKLAEEDELIRIKYNPQDEHLIRVGSIPRNTSLRIEKFTLTTKGYQRLREIQYPNQESRQAFVAMWFNEDMKKAYDKAIEPAIQYIDPDQTEPRFKALRIDNKEHVNDINDQIIAEIRRSRFMVCDLTGYRGGVYFEAGFAYGLGIPVIYTCRKDWTKPETLRITEDKGSDEVKHLYDSNGQAIRVGKEGVHFDLNHRNRIEWDPDNLEDFRTKLENRIRAVIY